jgi:4-hydroxybenzoate polyprenyltransferase
MSVKVEHGRIEYAAKNGIRILISVWKANIPVMVWMCIPVWLGPMIIGLGSETPEWGPIAILLVSVALIIAIAEFANTYTDRNEDSIYFPTSPFIIGELDAGIARKALVIENIVIGALLVVLLVLTSSYALIVAMLVAWFVALAYSMPPFRFKETVASPFIFSIGMAPHPIVAWLVVEPSLTAQSGLIIAFTVFFTLHSFGFGITQKLRKTYHAFNSGIIGVAQGSSIYSLNSVGLGLKVRTAMTLEATASLGAFILIPIFWHLGIFDAALSIGLLALPLPLTVLCVVLRIKDPVENSQKCALFMTMAWVLIGLMLLAVSLTDHIHWSLVPLACIVFPIGAILLTRAMHPFGLRAVTAPWKEL